MLVIHKDYVTKQAASPQNRNRIFPINERNRTGDDFCHTNFTFHVYAITQKTVRQTITNTEKTVKISSPTELLSKFIMPKAPGRLCSSATKEQTTKNKHQWRIELAMKPLVRSYVLLYVRTYAAVGNIMPNVHGWSISNQQKANGKSLNGSQKVHSIWSVRGFDGLRICWYLKLKVSATCSQQYYTAALLLCCPCLFLFIFSSITLVMCSCVALFVV